MLYEVKVIHKVELAKKQNHFQQDMAGFFLLCPV